MVGVPMNRFLAAGGTIALWLLLIPDVKAAEPPSGQPLSCARSWKYEKNSLQNARKLVTGPGDRKPEDRASCGLRALEALEALDKPDPSHECADCRAEYVGLLKDTADYLGKSAMRTKSDEFATSLYNQEIETRLTLGQFLIESDDKRLIDKYWSKNFDELGDALETINDGKRFHAQARMADAERLSAKSFGIWVRAVRSCAAWNFDSTAHMSEREIYAQTCSADCRTDLTRLRQRAELANEKERKEISDLVNDLLPRIEQCAEEK